ncbi:dnaJ homolog subfamily C member 27, partial [Corvus moneduloides]|uniref:dnaJ homolog subfamily C member 27 n=1 Tax=Corvus moneduloides TaxID=1196302 RepID=UPI001363E23C
SHQSRLLPNPPSPRLSRGLRGLIPGRNSQTFYSAIVDLCDNGGKRPPGASGVGFTREQADAIRRIRNSKDSWDTLGVKPGASREEVTRAYRHSRCPVIPGFHSRFSFPREEVTRAYRHSRFAFPVSIPGFDSRFPFPVFIPGFSLRREEVTRAYPHSRCPAFPVSIPGCYSRFLFPREEVTQAYRHSRFPFPVFIPGFSLGREEVTRAYRRLAVLLHPDKCAAPGSEDAFKALGGARSALLKNIK